MPNVLEWPAPCELTSFALSHKSRVLVLLCAWLESDVEHRGTENGPSSNWCMTTIQYWISRSLPLWSTTSPELRQAGGAEVPTPEEHDETIVVICNRNGSERGKSCSLFYLRILV